MSVDFKNALQSFRSAFTEFRSSLQSGGLWLTVLGLLVIYLLPRILHLSAEQSDLIVAIIMIPVLSGVMVRWGLNAWHHLKKLPALTTMLAITLPLCFGFAGRISARAQLANSFGMSPDVFPVTEGILTALNSLFLMYFVTAVLLVVMLLLDFFAAMISQGSCGRLKEPFLLIVPAALLLATPLYMLIKVEATIPELVRYADGQKSFYCHWEGEQPAAVIFLSDQQVLVWTHGSRKTQICPCDLSPPPSDQRISGPAKPFPACVWWPGEASRRS